MKKWKVKGITYKNGTEETAERLEYALNQLNEENYDVTDIFKTSSDHYIVIGKQMKIESK